MFGKHISVVDSKMFHCDTIYCWVCKQRLLQIYENLRSVP